MHVGELLEKYALLDGMFHDMHTYMKQLESKIDMIDNKLQSMDSRANQMVDGQRQIVGRLNQIDYRLMNIDKWGDHLWRNITTLYSTCTQGTTFTTLLQ